MRAEAFAVRHHVWANQQMAAFVRSVGPEAGRLRLDGTYGSVESTLEHLATADSACLRLLCGGERFEAALQERLQRNGVRWMEFLEQDFDPEARLTVHRRIQLPPVLDVPAGIVLAQALGHAADHRAQIAVTLSCNGIDPPELDVWAFALREGHATAQ